MMRLGAVPLLGPFEVGLYIVVVCVSAAVGLALGFVILRAAFSAETALWVEAARAVFAKRTLKRRAARIAALGGTHDGGAS